MSNLTVALVPLRGGSKSLPKKNIQPIGGRPLCAWTLEAALQAPNIDHVCVSTDCHEIASVVRNISDQIEIIDRPAEFATDSASTESVMLHFASVRKFDRLVTIQATSPLLKSNDLQQALDLFDENGVDSLLSGVIQKRFFWNLDGTPLNYDPTRRPRRQDWGGTLVENGAFYVTQRHILEKHRCRLGGKIGFFRMSEESYVELDEPSDWQIVDRLLRKQNLDRLNHLLSGIRLLMVDVDGTLTDGGMYYDSEGESLKKFCTRDAVGMRLIVESGLKVAIVTRESSPIAAARAKKLGFPCMTGVLDKRVAIQELADNYGIGLHQIAVIGDDINDIPAMEVAGFCACPKDSAIQVKAMCDLCLSAKGGNGAVRELCEAILAAQQPSPDSVPHGMMP